jgi:succinylarginine dihydrolase
MIERAYEVNFDGLPGPTHNYAGLSAGNNASQAHRHRVSHPRRAALEGLAKMRHLRQLGVRQAVLPPHERPAIRALRGLGFSGDTDAAVLASAARQAPHLLAAASSASAMWTANLATVSPSADTADGRAHFTPANLQSHWHRSLETLFSTRLLRTLFADESRFAVHDALPSAAGFGDEGAANHTRFCGHLDAHGEPGIHLFVDGGGYFSTAKQHPARQGIEAFPAMARLHGLDEATVVQARQNPAAIDAGVFHNDVISTGNRSFFLCHEESFANTAGTVEELRSAFARRAQRDTLTVRLVRSEELTMAEGVASYLFNSQIVDLPREQGMALIAPTDCERSERTRRLIENLIADQACPLRQVHYLDLRQSMANGGGPACLRLRVVLTEAELSRVQGRVLFNPALDTELAAWIGRNYREELAPADLADPALLEESRRALDELTQILRLPRLYGFQR